MRKKKKNKKQHIDFTATWGISCNELAEMENVTPEAIRMRVRNFGTPWQRRGKPTKWETKYGKTIAQLALERNLHPQTLARREYLFGDIDKVPAHNHPNAGQILNERGQHWTENPKMYYIKHEPTYMDRYSHEAPKTVPYGKQDEN